MVSWYTSVKDTIYLVAHIGGHLETAALLIRFLHGNTTVYFYRAPHSTGGTNYFKHKKEDAPLHDLKVPPVRYNLKLSEIPETLNKQVVFGHIDLESDIYYDIRDSSEQGEKVQMKFYFRSQFRKFNY